LHMPPKPRRPVIHAPIMPGPDIMPGPMIPDPERRAAQWLWQTARP
jgi:hypothetical protein